MAVAIGLRLLLEPWLGARQPFVTAFGASIGLAELVAYAVSALLIAALYVAMRKARASDERFRKFMENSPACVFIKDAAGRYVFMNAAAQKLVGVREWRGKTDEELLPAEVAARVRANDERVLAGETPASFALAYPGPNGPRHLHSTKFPLRDADGSRLVGSVTVDLTEQARSADELRLVADTMPVGLVRCSRDMKYKWVNRVFAGWVDRTPEEMAGMPIVERLGEAEMRSVLPYLERVLAGERVEYERLASFPRLGRRWIRAIAAPTFDAAGRPDGWVGVVSDVHDRKLMEEALRDADRRKDEFLATLAHELRNPLAPIRNAVAILHKKGPLDPELSWSRAVIDRQAGQMSRLIDDLLDIARIASGKLHVRKERMPLDRAIDMALETSRPNIVAAGHTLSVLMPSEPIFVEADPTRLAQVFSNLLNNAARYTEGRGNISLSAEVQGRHAAISVEDDGIGFPPEAAVRLFEPFSQLTSSHERSHGGLGIGLSLVQGIVELHGGTVEARSAGPGRGSEFVVRLPLCASGEAEAPRGPEKSAPPAGALRVLVADDNRDAADSLQRILALYGHEVQVAYDGMAAMRLAEQFEPRVAVLDIGMPGANGFEVARAVRERRGRGTALIALTGWGQDGDRRRAFDAGFDFHLTKPVDPGELNDLLIEIATEEK